MSPFHGGTAADAAGRRTTGGARHGHARERGIETGGTRRVRSSGVVGYADTLRANPTDFSDTVVRFAECGVRGCTVNCSFDAGACAW